MREILFRAKRIDNGEWLEGGYSYCKKDDTHYITNMGKDHISHIGFHQPIDPDTICQFTGLTDKNGNKIWENDVVKMTYRENYFENGVVRYYEQDVRYRFCVESGQFSFDNTDTIEVLGNIFDNPELLEEGAE